MDFRSDISFDRSKTDEGGQERSRIVFRMESCEIGIGACSLSLYS